MQLLFDAEASIETKEKMSSLEEASEKSLNDGIETLKEVVSNGNKENIQCQENIIKGIEDEVNGLDKIDASLPVGDSKLDKDEKISNHDDKEGNNTDVKSIEGEVNGFDKIDVSLPVGDSKLDKDEKISNHVIEDTDEKKNGTIVTEDQDLQDSCKVKETVEEVPTVSNNVEKYTAETNYLKNIESIENNETNNTDIMSATEEGDIQKSAESIVEVISKTKDKVEDIPEEIGDTVMEVKNESKPKDIETSQKVINNEESNETSLSTEKNIELVNINENKNTNIVPATKDSEIQKSPESIVEDVNISNRENDQAEDIPHKVSDTVMEVENNETKNTNIVPATRDSEIQKSAESIVEDVDISNRENDQAENIPNKVGDTVMEVENEPKDIETSQKVINKEDSTKTMLSTVTCPENIPDKVGDTVMEVEDEPKDIETSQKVINNEDSTETLLSTVTSTVSDTQPNGSVTNNEDFEDTAMDVDDSMLEKNTEKETSNEDKIESDKEVVKIGDNNIMAKEETLLESDSQSDTETIVADTKPDKDVTMSESTLIEEIDNKCISNDRSLDLNGMSSADKQQSLEECAIFDEEKISEKTTLGKEITKSNSPIDEINPTNIESLPSATKVIELENSTPLDKVESIDFNTSSKYSESFVEDKSSADKEGISDVDEMKEITKPNKDEETIAAPQEKTVPQSKPFSKLSNTLNILSDDEDDPPTVLKENEASNSTEKQFINIEDDDDIMLIDEDVDNKESTDKSASQNTAQLPDKKEAEKCEESTIDLENSKDNSENIPVSSKVNFIEKDTAVPEKDLTVCNIETKEEEKPKDEKLEKQSIDKPLLPKDFLKTYKKNLADMTREDLEEFCILKIVESIVDRSNLSDIKTKLKEMAQNRDEHKKKAMMLTKQNRDLQVVLKSVQEEQKKNADHPSVVKPLKITRSVGMQVLMTEKPGMRKKVTGAAESNNTNTNNRNVRSVNQNAKTQKSPAPNQTIPVPRLVPANNPVTKMPVTSLVNTPINTQAKTPASPAPNGVKNSPPVQKAEKRPISRVQSVTVDLTDDEPPAKITPRNSPAPPVRLVSPQNLLAPRPAFGQSLNSPRKVYIPISGQQGQNIRPGQAIMLKSVPAPGPGARPRAPPPLSRVPQNAVRMQSRPQNRHPAPLPDAVKQYQPPNWKALPPAPDLKLSKVENGIVISWKIEGYQEDSYEEIASYQLYAYQETSSPPSTALWKKIGDVKALPLPMACTLTHVMAGFKYYFAVRAVDIRSRLGPFSLPGSILLLNKL